MVDGFLKLFDGVGTTDVLRVAHKGCGGFYDFSSQTIKGDAVGFKTEQPAVDAAGFLEPLGVDRLPCFGDGKFGEIELLRCEDFWKGDVDGFDVFDTIELQIPDDAVPNDPTCRIVVNEEDEVHGFPDVDAFGFVVVDEVFHAQEGGLPTQCEDGRAKLFGDLFKDGVLAVFLTHKHDVPVVADFSGAGVVVEEAHVFVAHDVVATHEFHEDCVEDVRLFGPSFQGARAGVDGLDVGVPECADDALDGIELPVANLISRLPDDVFGRKCEVDGIGIARAKLFDEPLFGLKVDGNFV